MKTIKDNLNSITGGSCVEIGIYDRQYFLDIHEDVQRESLASGIVVGGLTAALSLKVLGLSSTSILLPVTLASFAYQYSYQTHELWPWN